MASHRTNAWLALRGTLVVAVLTVIAAPFATLGGPFGTVGVAHAATNTLVSSDPADGAVLAESPTVIELEFAQALGPKNTVQATCGANANARSAFSIGEAQVRDGVKLVVEVPTPMPKGSCAIAWLVSTPTGEVDASSSFEFTITADTAPTVAVTTAITTAPTAATTAGAPSADDGAASDGAAPRVGGPLGLGRLLTTLGLAMVLGSLVLIALAWPEGVEYILTVRFLRSAWITSLVGAVLTVVCLTAQVTGKSLGASVSPSAWMDLKETGPGIAALVRLVATAAIGWVVLQPERALDQTTQLPALAIPAIAVATLGFSRSGGDMAAIGALAGIAHALAMAVWLGGLVLLWRVVLAGPGDDDLVHAVRGFGRLATPALLVTVVTGAVQTYRLDSGNLFSTGHGGVLLLKASIVGAMAFVGLATRQFVNQRLSHVESMTAGMAGRLRRAISVEVAGGVTVLVLSAWLLALAPGNVDATGASTAKYAFTQRFELSADVDVTVSFSQVVGRNGLLVTVDEPAAGITDLTVRFDPPADSGAIGGAVTIPLPGKGSAELAITDGVSIAVPGTWSITVSATTATGTVSAQKNVVIPVAETSATTPAASTG